MAAAETEFREVIAEAPVIERLSEDDLAYHKKVMAAVTAAEHVRQSWGQHLATKYKLTGAAAIDEDGVITRG